ncbi:hypothetical protein TNCV_2322901 [Trichonephila clavipes]|nr:hypothetical protein TNCV_2322901 [Trichonephila clavipes]
MCTVTSPSSVTSNGAVHTDVTPLQECPTKGRQTGNDADGRPPVRRTLVDRIHLSAPHLLQLLTYFLCIQNISKWKMPKLQTCFPSLMEHLAAQCIKKKPLNFSENYQMDLSYHKRTAAQD